MEEAPVTIDSPEKSRLAEVRGSVNYTGDPNGDPSPFFHRPIHFAAENQNDNVKAIEHLLFRGADVNAETINGLTALHIAVSKRNRKIVEYLLENGAEVRIQGRMTQDTALHVAAFHNDSEEVFERDSPEYKNRLSIMKSLLRRRSNIEALNRFRETPLLKAVKGRHLGILKTLLAAGADVHAKNYLDQTCLHVLLATPGKIDMMIELVKAGVNVGDRDHRGRTALQNILDRVELHLEKMEEAKALIKISMLINNDESTNLSPYLGVGQELLRFKSECQSEISRMRNSFCISKHLHDFAKDGVRNVVADSRELVLEAVFQILMVQNFDFYGDFIQAHFRRSYLVQKLKDRHLYTRQGLTDVIFPPHLIDEICIFLSVKDLFNLLKVLFNSLPPEQ